MKTAGVLPADVSLFSDLLDAVMSCREVVFDYHKLTAHLAGLEDITRWILSWGSKARVIAPPALKERVRREVEKMVRTA